MFARGQKVSSLRSSRKAMPGFFDGMSRIAIPERICVGN